jgi:hydrogenase expression/formation protein HypC
MCLAVPGEVISITPSTALSELGVIWQTGLVRFGGVVKEINLAYVPELKVGDYVLVHVGFALSIIDPIAAQKSLDNLIGVLEGDLSFE